jgi:EAL and modified HD-GYP domain-containing signal transduction protein
MSAVVPPALAGPTKFLARQPILDRSQRVVGYELLFRSGMENYFPDVDIPSASRSVIDKSLLVGIDVLCEGQKAFVNCTPDVLLNQLITVLPPATTVIEILEWIEVTDELQAACRALRNSGYMLALDDFVPGGPQKELLGVADVLKLDVEHTRPEELGSFVREQLARGRWLVAEKVETLERFQEARSVGFTHFQGYFFARPTIVGIPELPAITLNRIRLLRCIAGAELNYREMETVLKGDPALCYRLLRYMNSALFSLPCNVSSVRHALSLLGDQEIRRWVALVVAVTAVQDKPAALLRLALLRAQFCGSLGALLQSYCGDLFLLGLFSLMDTILDMPMPELLDRVRLPEPIRQTLLGQSTSLDQIMKLVYALESGDWDCCEEVAKSLGVTENAISQLYLESVAWTRQFAALF